MHAPKLEWPDENKNNDGNHQRGRNLVDEPVKFRAMAVLIFGKIADARTKISMNTGHDNNQRKFGMKPDR